MVKKIFYLYPEVEGKQYFVCWGIEKGKTGKDLKGEVKSLVLEGLNTIKDHQSHWISRRSFSVFFGEDPKYFWIAVPRQLTAKTMKILGNKFLAYNPKIIITSLENPFGGRLPFRPVISYDRGFIFDSSSIEEKLANHITGELAANI